MQTLSTQYELSLTDYWRILRKRYRVVLFSIIIVSAASAIYLKQQAPIYKASSVIKIEQSEGVSGGLFSGYRGYYENPMVTESRVIESRSIADMIAKLILEEKGNAEPAAVERLGGAIYGSITAVPIEETNLIRITATSTDQNKVAQLANLAAQAYLQFNLNEKNRQAAKVRKFVESQVVRTEVRLKMVEEAIRRLKENGDASGRATVLQNKISALRSDLANLTPKLTDVHPDVIRLKVQLVQLEAQLSKLPKAELDLSRLNRELAVTENSYKTLRGRLEEARIAEAEKIANAAIIESATVPSNAIHLKKQVGFIVGAVLGLILGCIFAFIVETMDTSIGTIEEIEALMQVPVLAVMPHYDGDLLDPANSRWRFRGLKRLFRSNLNANKNVGLFAHESPHAPITEACRILRTNLKLSAQMKTILVTSAGPGEGKTTLLSNLGIVTAQSGSKTLMISADLRRPQLGRVFDLQKGNGLSEVLRGDLSLQAGVKGLSDFILGALGYEEAMKNPYLANLFILTAGHVPENPTEVLASSAMHKLIQESRNLYDVVYLDGAPLLPVADSMLLAPHVDGVVLVYQVGRISRAALMRAKVQLESAGANLLGVVLNHVQPEVQTLPPDYYYYRQKEGSESEFSADRGAPNDSP